MFIKNLFIYSNYKQHWLVSSIFGEFYSNLFIKYSPIGLAIQFYYIDIKRELLFSDGYYSNIQSSIRKKIMLFQIKTNLIQERII